METITLLGKKYNIEKTDLERIAYTLTRGKKTLKGVRSHSNPDIITVVDLRSRFVSVFRESSGKELVRGH